MSKSASAALKIKYCPICGYGDESIFSWGESDFSGDEGHEVIDQEFDEGAVNGGDWTCQNCHHEVGAYCYGGTGDAFDEDDNEDDESAAERRLFLSMILTIGLFMAFVYFLV